VAILAAISGAILGFLFAWILQNRKIKAEQKTSSLEYERGRREEEERQKHEKSLLKEELESRKDMESNRQLIATTMPVYNYFIGLVRKNYNFEDEFPAGESATLLAVVSRLSA